MVDFFKTKVKAWVIIVDAVLCSALLNIMDFILFPKIQASTTPIKAFDLQTFGYSYNTALQFIKNISEKGKEIYLCQQLPLDFLFPILYSFLFIALFIKLSDKASKFIVFPLLLFVCDYGENVCTALMLKSGVTFSRVVSTIGSIMSASKSVLMYICAILIIVLLIMYFINKNKSKVVVK